MIYAKPSDCTFDCTNLPHFLPSWLGMNRPLLLTLAGFDVISPLSRPLCCEGKASPLIVRLTRHHLTFYFLPRGAIMNDRHNVWCGLAISPATMSSDCLISPLLRDQQHARTLPRCSHLTYLTLWAFSNISKYISRKYEPSWRVAAIHFHPIRRHNYT